MAQSIFFWLFAIITLVCAFAVVRLSNIVHSAFCLMASMLGVAALFLLMQSEFLAAVQILIYVGSATILIIFALMLVGRPADDLSRTNRFGRFHYPGALVSILFFLTTTGIIFSTKWPVKSSPLEFSTVEGLANVMLNRYVVSLEFVAVLLLVAIIAAILIAKEVNE